MFAEQSCWGIDIGRSSLKAVRLRRIGEKVELADIVVLDYFTEGVEPPGAAEIQQALVEFRTKKKVSAAETVAVALPGYSMFSRFIKLPSVETKRFEDVVKYEAASQIPFPMTDVIWNYYRAGGEVAGEEIDVGIFAVKHDVIKDYLSNFDSSKVFVDIVTAAPIALYNFAKYEMDVPEQAVLVDIGADHTDLVIMDGDKFYVRNIATAGNDITKAIQEEFDLSFAQAEQLKMKVAKSKQAEKIFAVMQPVLNTLIGQIRYSIRYYRSQTKSDTEFRHLILLGNATRLEGLASYFADSLDMQIHDFFDIVQIDLSRDLARDSVRVEVLKEHLPSLAVALGLALQGQGKGVVDVNFLPPERRAERAVARKRPAALVAVSLIFILLFVMSLTYGRRASALKKALDEGLEPRYNKLSRLNREVKKASNYGDWAYRARQLKQFAETRLIPLRILNDINSVVTSAGLNLRAYPKRLDGRDYNEIYEEIRPEMKRLDENKIWLLSLTIEATEKEGDETGMGTDEKKAEKKTRRRRKKSPKKGELPPLADYKLSYTVKMDVALIDKGGAQITKTKVEELLGRPLAEKYALDPSILVEVPTVNEIKSLLSNPEKAKNQSDGSAQTYRRFTLKWKLPPDSAEEKRKEESDE